MPIVNPPNQPADKTVANLLNAAVEARDFMAYADIRTPGYVDLFAALDKAVRKAEGWE